MRYTKIVFFSILLTNLSIKTISDNQEQSKVTTPESGDFVEEEEQQYTQKDPVAATPLLPTQTPVANAGNNRTEKFKRCKFNMFEASCCCIGTCCTVVPVAILILNMWLFGRSS